MADEIKSDSSMDTGMSGKSQASKSSGDNKIIFILTYFFTWLSGLIVYLTMGKDPRFKKHGMQAIILGVIATVLSIIPIIGLVSILIWLYGLYVGYMAYTGTDVEIPVVSGLVK